MLETDEGAVGRLRTVRFEDTGALEKVGQSLIRALPQAGAQPIDRPRVAVGFVEGSNVSLTAEVAQLLQTARAFEAAMRSLRMNDQMTQSLIRMEQ